MKILTDLIYMGTIRSLSSLYKTTIWGCISCCDAGALECMNGTVNLARYRDILDKNLWPVVAKHFGDKEYLFQEDGASKVIQTSLCT